MRQETGSEGDPSKFCANCGANTEGASATVLLRCSRCKTCWYCSRTCQKADWKKHKRVCKVISEQIARDAWKELKNILLNTSPEQAHEAFHKTKEEIVTIMARKEPPSTVAVEKVRGNAKKLDDRNGSSEKSMQHQGQSIEDESVFATLPLTMEPGLQIHPSEQSSERQNYQDAYFEFYIEEFPHLQSVQLEIRPRSSNDLTSIALEHWSVRVEKHNETETSILFLHNSHHEHTLIFQLPWLVKDSLESVSVVNGRLSLRLAYQSNGEIPLGSHPISQKSANQLRCLGCKMLLVTAISSTENERIARVASLPSGWWDDMSDYLVCYDGQASVDFSSCATAARPGLVLEDDMVLVYHTHDVAPNVQVLALPAYGDAEEEGHSGVVAPSRAVPTVRGNRAWADTVGGATVTCSHCCLVLGCAPVEMEDTLRFYKHRVTTFETEKGTSLLSSLKFCVHSMIRYAESKAVFSFLVRCADRPTTGLVLELVGWDRKAACSFHRGSTINHELAWSRLAKVLYEEQDGIMAPVQGEDSKTTNNWMWTQGDWCCPPDNTAIGSEWSTREDEKVERTNNLPASYVSLYLEADEWNSVKQELLEASSSLYTNDLVQATFLAKKGRLPEKGAFAGLAGIFLDLKS